VDALVTLFILVIFIGFTAWIFEYKILPSMPVGEPWNWIARVIFWLIVILVLWKFVWPVAQGLHF
jgi:hypothetical protein